jgi:hypothetical protein
LAQIGSSHCSQNSVLPFGGAAFSGSVIGMLAGGEVGGLGAKALAALPPPEAASVPLDLLEPPQAASASVSAAAHGRNVLRPHVMRTLLHVTELM